MASTVTLTVTIRCDQCGTVPFTTIEEAAKRFEQHCQRTGHVVVLEAVRTG